MKKSEMKRCLFPYTKCTTNICCAFCKEKHCPEPYKKCTDDYKSCPFAADFFSEPKQETIIIKNKKTHATQMSFNDL